MEAFHNPFRKKKNNTYKEPQINKNHLNIYTSNPVSVTINFGKKTAKLSLIEPKNFVNI